MKQFLDQFHLPIKDSLFMERVAFALAEKSIRGYNGGNWKSEIVEDVRILMIPESDTGLYTFRGTYADTTTDRLTASAAFTYILVNHVWHMLNGRLNEQQNDAFHTQFFDIRNMVYADDATHCINTNDFFAITD